MYLTVILSDFELNDVMEDQHWVVAGVLREMNAHGTHLQINISEVEYMEHANEKGLEMLLDRVDDSVEDAVRDWLADWMSEGDECEEEEVSE